MRLLLITVFLLLVACADTPYQTQLNSYWQGKSANTLLQNWGTPEITVTPPGGNTHFAYITNSYSSFPTPPEAPYTVSAPRDGKPVLVRVPTESNDSMTQLKCQTSFEINKQQHIISVSLEGNNCQQDPKFVKRIEAISPH